MMKKAALKAVLSSLLILLFIFLAFTGALLFFGKTGVVWGISRGALRSCHFAAAITICVLIIIHLILNRRQYFSELRALIKKRIPPHEK